MENLVYFGPILVVATLLQNPRARASVNEQGRGGNTPPHEVCEARLPEAEKVRSLILFLQAGADPSITNNQGLTPVDILRRVNKNPSITIIEGFPDAQKDAERAALLVKARRLVVAANQDAVVPSYLQGRVLRGQPLPRVELSPLVGDRNNEVEQEGRMLRRRHAARRVPGGGRFDLAVLGSAATCGRRRRRATLKSKNYEQQHQLQQHNKSVKERPRERRSSLITWAYRS